MTAKKTKTILFSVSAVLLVLLIVLNVVALVMKDTITLALSTTSLDSASRAKGEELALQIEEEGIVMVKNEQDTLPLASVDKVNVFGWASTQWIMGGSGSGRAVNSNNGNSAMPQTDLLGALTSAGIEYNTELTDMYKRFHGVRPFYTDLSNGGALHYHDYEYSRLFEPDITNKNFYTDSLLESAKSYSDVALVVLGRVTGESNDCPTAQYKNTDAKGKPSGANVDATRTYLEISTEEEGLLRYVGENYDKV
ncbi:MAG: glycoside hydrolase family 3 C-terminal domain-containing protein, partial [Clostridia bacterium]|nr:glycoside hydrolase family 3 C-terminal domain-containing protein [Clostridia bacterium]